MCFMIFSKHVAVSYPMYRSHSVLLEFCRAIDTGVQGKDQVDVILAV